MKITIQFLLVLSTFPAVGQNHYIGTKFGLNVTNVHLSNFTIDNENRIGFIGGLTYEYKFNSKLSFETDFLYSQKGFTKDLFFTYNTGTLTGEKTTTYFNYDYLSIPVKIGFGFGNKVSGFSKLGIVPSILINAKTIEGKIDGISDEHTYNLTEQVRRFDFSGLVEVGCNFKIHEQFLIFSSLAYQQSFTTITNDDYFSDSKIKHYGISVFVGLKYAL
jgi:hypothetical protein